MQRQAGTSKVVWYLHVLALHLLCRALPRLLQSLRLAHLLEHLDVALVLGQLVVVKVDDIGGDRVEEVAVMGNDKQRALKVVAQVVFQPQHCLEVLGTQTHRVVQ